ncbi:MAG: COX15/CtaA family protein [bacterium]
MSTEQRNIIWLKRLLNLTIVWVFVVIMLGAFVRLSDAGLGCPDWPTCYGHLAWPESVQEAKQANQLYPERPVESHKAWKEMVHRYFAGTLGLLVLSVSILSFKLRKSLKLPLFPIVILPPLILFQAALGMWTVTLLLKPFIVSSHLLGGMATMALLAWLRFSLQEKSAKKVSHSILTVLALAVVIQIFLGGWTSANYAAMACPDFPTCQAQWWPETDFKDAFVLWRGLGIDYEGGVLDHPARVAIHLAHRIGATFVFIIGLLCVLMLWRVGEKPQASLLAGALGVQVTLGISNVVFALPLPIAVLHNGGAALLLFSTVLLLNRYKSGTEL